jgi:hypothetical protein
MAEIDDSYQAKVGREQGGALFYMKEDGLFKFFDTDWEGKALRNFIGSFFDVATYGGSGTGLSGPIQLSRNYGYYVYSLGTSTSLGSINLPSAWKGARLVIDGTSMVLDANIIADGSLLGDSFYGKNGVALSSLNISATGIAVLFCAAEGVWTVAESNASVSEQAAA